MNTTTIARNRTAYIDAVFAAYTDVTEYDQAVNRMVESTAGTARLILTISDRARLRETRDDNGTVTGYAVYVGRSLRYELRRPAGAPEVTPQPRARQLPPTNRPSVILSRVLRSLGLVHRSRQGQRGEFTVAGDYENGERVGTYAMFSTPYANHFAAENADLIEQETAAAGHPFRVSVNAFDGRPRVLIANNNVSSLREPFDAERPAR